MKIQKLLMIALAATTFAACSNDDEEPTPQQPAQTTRPLTISVTENPFVDPDGNPTTRGAITTTGTLSAFKMDYVYELGEERPTNGTALTATKGVGNTWTTDATWPTAIDYGDKTVDWYAYTGSETVFHTGGTKSGDYISFTVDETIADQNDLLVATAGGTYDGTGGRLSFTFDHACAALRFYMKKAKNISGYTLTVTEVKLRNIVKEGNYYFDSQSWTLGSTPAYYTLFAGTQALNDVDYVALDTSAKPYLFLIPQTLTEWNGTGSPANTYLEITCTIRQGDDTVFDNGTAYIPFGYTLEKGTQYDVNINIGKNSLYKNDGTKVIP